MIAELWRAHWSGAAMSVPELWDPAATCTYSPQDRDQILLGVEAIERFWSERRAAQHLAELTFSPLGIWAAGSFRIEAASIVALVGSGGEEVAFELRLFGAYDTTTGKPRLRHLAECAPAAFLSILQGYRNSAARAHIS